MKFDFSKSNNSDLQNKLSIIKLDLLLKEQQQQRMDLATILRLLNRLSNDFKLQKQVDEFFEETPPQTESVEQDAPR